MNQNINKMDKLEVDQIEIMPGVSLVDALAEIANVGAGNSSTKLEKVFKEKIAKNLMGNSIDITPQIVEYCHLTNIEWRFPLTTHAGFYSLLKIGDGSAMISVLFSMESALFITGILDAKEKHYEILREEDENTLKGIADALIDSYIDSTSNFLQLPIAHVQTRKVYLKPSSLSDFVKENIGVKSDIALLFKTGFSVKNTSFKGDVKIILSLVELDSIINAIRKNLGLESAPCEHSDLDNISSNINCGNASTISVNGVQQFNLYGGGALRSLADLKNSLEVMQDHIFFHHVTPFRNDFASWTYDVFHEKELAQKIGEEKTREMMKKILNDYFRKYH